MKSYIRIAAAAIITAALALAQGPGIARMGLRHHADLSQLKTYLSLTDSQVTQLQQAQQQLHTANRAIFEQLATKEKALRESLSGGTSDATSVGRMVLDIQALRNQLKTSRENAVTTAVANLTGAQKAKLAELEAASKLAPVIGQAHMLNLLSGPDRDVFMFGPQFDVGPIGHVVADEPFVTHRVEIRR